MAVTFTRHIYFAIVRDDCQKQEAMSINCNE